jgi:hypothetical protein
MTLAAFIMYSLAGCFFGVSPASAPALPVCMTDSPSSPSSAPVSSASDEPAAKPPT